MRRKYNNPPIIEAVCEIRFEPGEKWDSTRFGLIWEKVQVVFPQREELRHLDVRLVPGPEGVQQKVTGQARVKYLQQDGLSFMQVGENVVSVHRLKPYRTWAEFKPVIVKGFSAYTQQAKPSGIRRAGLRYINRIPIPAQNGELVDYFDFLPSVGPAMLKEYGPFIVGIDVPFEEGRDGLRIQLASAQPESDDEVPVMLDLDYRTLRADSLSLDGVEEWLELAHGRVEDTFEGCIKDALRNMFAQAE